MAEWLVPAIGGLVALLLGGGFGYYARKTHEKLGKVKNERDQLQALQDDYEKAMDIVLAPDATLSELDRVSRARAEAAERLRLQGRKR